MNLPTTSALSRRQLLGGGALLAAGWVTAQVVGRWPPPQDSPFLGAGARRALGAAFDALLPDPARAEALADGVDRYLAGSDPLVAGQLRVALLVLEHGGGLGLLSFRAFSERSREEREQLLTSWERSRLGPKRQIAAALRKVAMFSYYSLPEVWPELGYDGPWVR